MMTVSSIGKSDLLQRSFGPIRMSSIDCCLRNSITAFELLPVSCDVIAWMRRIEPYIPLFHGVPRADDRRVVSGIIFVIRNGLRWRDAPNVLTTDSSFRSALAL